MDRRRSLLANTWAQLILVIGIVIAANTWAAGTFARLDLTSERVYSLDLATRALLYRLEKPLLAKVYFSKGLQAPYNNHEQVLLDKLEDFRAYSKGLMDIEVADPTGIKELTEEAQRFGIEPIQYRYRSSQVTELKKVYMGVALVYGDRQEVLSAVTVTDTLEYELARAVKRLVSEEGPRTVGWTLGNGEPNLLTGSGPLERIRSKLTEEYNLQGVDPNAEAGIPEEVDALFVVGPQRPFSPRAQYEVDQFLMRGGALAMFLTNTKPDMRTMQPQSVVHNLEAMMGKYGVQLNRDIVVDRTRNGQMNLPVRQGRYMVRMPVNYPLIPRVNIVEPDHPTVRGIDTMLFPFASSIELANPLPGDVEATVLAKTTEAGGRIRGLRSIDPQSLKTVALGEERDEWTILVALDGTFESAFANRAIPLRPDGTKDDGAGRIRESAPTRLITAGSADFVANNVSFMLNLVDWMVQDETLVSIRAKQVRMPEFDPIEPGDAQLAKAANLLTGSALLFLFGLVRWGSRRRDAGMVEPAPKTEEVDQ
jgi:gliding-associated putative ABC transporter substrate-binding component GldG